MWIELKTFPKSILFKLFHYLTDTVPEIWQLLESLQKLFIFRRKKHLSSGMPNVCIDFFIERVFWKRVQAGKRKLHKLVPSLEKEDSRCLHVNVIVWHFVLSIFIHLSPQLKWLKLLWITSSVFSLKRLINDWKSKMRLILLFWDEKHDY